MGKKRFIYMVTTRDKYELPIAVADSTKELAEMLGLPHKTVSMYMSPVNQTENGRGKRAGFHKIPWDEEDEEEI